ncbi:MAG: hypothetical protein ACI4OS_08160 [Akkermansia sp.]
MRHSAITIPAAAALLLSPVSADISSLPPGDVRPEEVYTPEQMAEQTLRSLEDALQRLSQTVDPEQHRAAEQCVSGLMSHICADPDLNANVHQLLKMNPDRAQRLHQLLERAGQALPHE